jgi:hypothetical protein
MESILKNNAYHILGLDASASQKDILKRSKEIINRLRIDDFPEYSFDIGLFEDFRTENSVKEAVQRLQFPKKRIKEYFFWFQITDETDERAIKSFKEKDYSNAVRTWKEAAENNGAKANLYKKNLAILYFLLLSSEDNKEYLRESLFIWKELIDSDKFWNFFSKIYKLHEGQTASQEIVTEFRKGIVSDLSDLYTELHQIHRCADYINDFQKIFSARGQRVEKTVLVPAYQAINTAVEGLEQMKISEDGIIDKEETEQIKRFVGIIQSELNKLIDLGLYNDSQTKIIRDRVANALRQIVLDLHNNLSELDRSLKLLEVAVQICGTDALKSKLENEVEQIKKNIEEDAESSLVLEIPGTLSTGVLIFKINFVEYDNKKIFYKDVLTVSYYSVKNSVNFIPTSQSYNFTIASDRERISFSFSSILYIGNKAKQDTWMKLIALSKHLIEPLLVQKLVRRIFEKGETIDIGGVQFDKNGYCRSKFFGGKEYVSWNETVYVPQLDAGDVVLFKDNNGKGKQFTRISMSTVNAVILPELIKACVNHT